MLAPAVDVDSPLHLGLRRGRPPGFPVSAGLILWPVVGFAGGHIAGGIHEGGGKHNEAAGLTTSMMKPPSAGLTASMMKPVRVWATVAETPDRLPSHPCF
jgi:hypothetical protein